MRTKVFEMKKVSGVILAALFLVGVLSLAFNIQQVKAGPTLGMISYWKFDENTGRMAFDSVDHNIGTIYGATWVSGIVNSALSFDGINDYVKIPDSDNLDITGDLTIEAWVNTSQTGLGWIFSNCLEVSPHDGFTLELYNGKARFYSQNSDLFSASVINTGTWKHIAVTLSGTTATIYVDGVLDSSGTVNTPNVNTVDQTIGASYALSYFFQGLIDEVAIYNRALTASEIQQHYQNGLMGMSYYVETALVPIGGSNWPLIAGIVGVIVVIGVVAAVYVRRR